MKDTYPRAHCNKQTLSYDPTDCTTFIAQNKIKLKKVFKNWEMKITIRNSYH